MSSRFRVTLNRRLWSLDGAALCAQARRRTGLGDFGEPSLEPALTVLLESLETEANLRALGRFLMHTHVRDLLETRLRLTQAWKGQWSRLEQERIEKPVFIVGMPRSGSTFLHELLAENPQHRAPRVWEVMFPLSGDSKRQGDKAQRIRRAKACLWWFRRLAPRADAVYPMRALTPHECVAIHSYTFLSEEFVSTCQTPAYERFLHRIDRTPAYLWQKRFLQHLQLGSPAQRWILKSPDHVYALDELFRVFPDACIVQTHRNPAEVLESSADLTRVLRALYGPPGELDEVRAREARILAEGTERFIRFRDLHPELAHRFIDVRYTDLIRDPAATVQRIFEHTETPFTQAAVAQVQRLAANRSRYRGRRASAEPAGLRLAMTLEAERFERYCARFGLSLQRVPLK